MKTLHKIREAFTLPGLIAIGLLAGGTLLFLWFLFVVEQAQADEPRAVTAADHCACMTLPRGNQEMENERQKCFTKLYGTGRFKIDRRLVASNQDNAQACGRGAVQK